MRVVPALAVALISTIGVGSVAQAAVINFAVSGLDGKPGYTGKRLDLSSAFNFDGSTLFVSEVGPGDASGLVPFDTVSLSPTDIVYGSGSGKVDVSLPGSGVRKTWTDSLGTFTEDLTTVTEINRNTLNAITVDLSGTLNGPGFTDTPIEFILQANQVGGPKTAISAGFTNTTVVGGVPETSTWVMLALGFGGLAYAAVRRNAKDRSALAI